MGESVFLPFLAFTGHLYSLASGLFLHLQNQQQRIFISFCDSVFLIPHLKGHCDYTESTGYSKMTHLLYTRQTGNSHSICSLSSPLPCNNILTGSGN